MLLPTNNKNTFFRLFKYLVVILVIGIAVFAVLNQQNIYDWYKLRNYTPPPEVVSLANSDSMTPYADKIFKVNHPKILNKSDFSVHCPNNGGEQTIVLGCYKSDQNGIYILNVTDPRLSGVEEVTSAHEMLHAAYDRLNKKDKDSVNAMLVNFFNNDLKDQRIIDTINAYKKTEPNDVVNEMHSVFGTEVANLPAPLEAYYKKYFIDRSKVTAFASSYQSEFTSRQNIVNQDDQQLMSYKNDINSLNSDLTSKLAQIKSLQNQLNNLKSSGDISAYNAQVPNYNAQVDSYNIEVDNVKTKIAAYNQLVAQRNAVALTENSLLKELQGSNSPISP